MEGQTETAQDYVSAVCTDGHALVTKDVIIRGGEQNHHLALSFCKPIAFLFWLSIITLWDLKSYIKAEVLI